MSDTDKGQQPNRHPTNLKWLLLLHALMLVFSLTGVMSKLASRQEPLSPAFMGFYGAMLAILAFYALAWQQVIKRMPLTAAYANRAVTVVWGIVWGVLVFHEGISPLKLVGAAVVLAGVVLFAIADNEDARAPEGSAGPEEGGE